MWSCAADTGLAHLKTAYTADARYRKDVVFSFAMLVG